MFRHTDPRTRHIEDKDLDLRLAACMGRKKSLDPMLVHTLLAKEGQIKAAPLTSKNLNKPAMPSEDLSETPCPFE
ncbi:uncharacterized protein KY384_007814 [Bacidia gigantensis]|uniref:uncharacterized protein n=1 Tax=Bacidia gigantensis TaxID=2732470 RepID=UPI001D04920B|nr:uncharacterized protein KY384_007814 [Bacidia gigantensis]KAG8527661.1 hypothetical protein KY384_007814 [Bacidia gigantensis]